jgi:DNA-binding transcriptional ArsR family regulator
MRALAHPARMAILEYLMTDGPATATECAEVVGQSPSATSYHLRALAKVGLVEEAPSRGDGRERLWQTYEYGLELDADAVNDPLARAAEKDLIAVLLDRQFAKVNAWYESSLAEGEEWRDAAAFTESRLLMTSAEMGELQRAIASLINPYRFRSRKPDPPAGARTVTSIFYLFADPEVASRDVK